MAHEELAAKLAVYLTIMSRLRATYTGRTSGGGGT